MTKEKIMLIAGCSHAAGSEIDGTEDSYYNRQHTFGNILAQKMGYKPINIALNGATNTGIARSVLEWFDNHYNDQVLEVFTLVAWTESVRMEVPVDWSSSYQDSNPNADWFSDTCKEYLRVNMGWKGTVDREKPIIAYHQEFMAKSTQYLELVSVNVILQLQYFLKMLNVNYLMCNTLHMFNRTKQLDFYLDKIDKTRYINFDNNDECFYWKYRNNGFNNTKAKYWHHGEEPHRLFADELFQFLK